MPRVAVAQLSLDLPQRVRILLNGDKHGFRHACNALYGEMSLPVPCRQLGGVAA